NLAAWQPHVNRLRGVLPHQAGVCAIAFSPDGRTLATASYDRTARLWDTVTGKPVGEPMKHQGEVVAVAFSPDGRLVLTADHWSRDRAARFWDALTGKPVGQPLEHASVEGVAFSPDGKFALTAGCEPAPQGTSGTPSVRVWNVADRDLVGKPLRH